MTDDPTNFPELMYWILGLGVPIALTLVFFLVFRLSRQAEGRIDPSPAVEPEPTPASLADALANTRSSFFGRLRSVFTGTSALSPTEREDLEEVLYTSDLGPQTVQRLLSAIDDRAPQPGTDGFEAARAALKQEMLDIFAAADGADAGRLNVSPGKPTVILVVGVNGAGKTTTIGKLAAQFARAETRVLVAAGDTFRAAAGEQLKAWTDRARVEIFLAPGVADPSAVAFDACQIGKQKEFDVVIVDTAGRLHTQANLMEELKKMKRVIGKAIPGAPHETLLVLDANSGQNALQQAREFHRALGVTGVVLTKLDGTAKGGVAVGLACELRLPIKLIGVGERVEDLRDFSAREFVESIL